MCNLYLITYLHELNVICGLILYIDIILFITGNKDIIEGSEDSTEVQDSQESRKKTLKSWCAKHGDPRKKPWYVKVKPFLEI